MKHAILIGTAIAFVVATYVGFTRINGDDDPGEGLGPVAFEILDHCIDAAIRSEQLSNETFADEIRPQIDAYAGTVVGNLHIQIEEDYACLVRVPVGNYIASAIREHLETQKSTNFDGRTDHCSWVIGLEGGRATGMQCSFRAEAVSGWQNAFTLSAGIFPSEGAMFAVNARMIFDRDGYIRLVD